MPRMVGRRWLGFCVVAWALAAAPLRSEDETERAGHVRRLSRLLTEDPREVEVEADEARHTYPYDARIWLLLAKARLQIPSAAWAAELPLQRAAEVGDGAQYSEARELARRAGLEVPPERIELVDVATLREHAARASCDAARRLRRDGGCPVRKAPFGWDKEGRATCAFHPRSNAPEVAFRVSEALLIRALAAKEVWLRVQALDHSDATDWSPAVLHQLLGETEPEVRLSALARLLASGPTRRYETLDQRVARAWSLGADPLVWEYAQRLLATVGQLPAPHPERLAWFLPRMGPQGSSFGLGRHLLRDHPAAVHAACRRILSGPPGNGQKPTLMLLSAGGTDSARVVLSALERDPPGLWPLREACFFSMELATGEDHGRDLGVWRAALGRR